MRPPAKHLLLLGFVLFLAAGYLVIQATGLGRSYVLVAAGEERRIDPHLILRFTAIGTSTVSFEDVSPVPRDGLWKVTLGTHPPYSSSVFHGIYWVTLRGIFGPLAIFSIGIGAVGN